MQGCARGSLSKTVWHCPKVICGLPSQCHWSSCLQSGSKRGWFLNPDACCISTIAFLLLAAALDAWNVLHVHTRLRTNSSKTQVLGRNWDGYLAALQAANMAPTATAKVLGVTIGIVPRTQSNAELTRALNANQLLSRPCGADFGIQEGLGTSAEWQSPYHWGMQSAH